MNRNCLATIALSFFSLIVSMTLGELLLQALNPERSLPINGWKDYKKFTWGHEVINNSLGFRDAEHDRVPTDDKFRIILIGDSLTWGVGLSTKERYGEILQALLSEVHALPVEAINFAVPGGPTVVERDILKKFAPDFAPNLIILGFCLNDPQPREENWSSERDQFLLKISPFLNFTDGLTALGFRELGKRSVNAVLSLAERADFFPDWHVALSRSYNPVSPEWKEFLSALKEISDISLSLTKRPAIFISLNQGIVDATASDYTAGSTSTPRSRYQLAEAAASDAGFLVVNVEEEIGRLSPDRLLKINAVDGHPSAELNQIYARKLFETIVQNKLLD